MVYTPGHASPYARFVIAFPCTAPTVYHIWSIGRGHYVMELASPIDRLHLRAENPVWGWGYVIDDGFANDGLRTVHALDAVTSSPFIIIFFLVPQERLLCITPPP